MEIVRQDTSGLFDGNIQSDFYPDSSGDVWFCTFTGFYAYDLKRHQIRRFRIPDHNGDTFTSEYRIIGLLGTTLLMYVGEEIINFDIKRLTTTHRWCFGKCPECALSALTSRDGYHVYIGNTEGLTLLTLSSSSDSMPREGIIVDACADLCTADNAIWAAARNGYLYKVAGNRLVEHISLRKQPIKLKPYGHNIIINYGDTFSFYNRDLKFESEPISLYYGSHQLENIEEMEIDKDSILWVSGNGDAVYSTQLGKPFKNFIRELPDIVAPNVTMIGKAKDGQIVAVSQNRGVLVLNSAGEIMRTYEDDKDGRPVEPLRVMLYEDGIIYHREGGRLEYFNTSTGDSKLLTKDSGSLHTSISVLQYLRYNEKTILASTVNSGVGILTIDLARGTYHLAPFAMPLDQQKIYTYFARGNDGNLYISYNEEAIHVFEPDSSKGFRYFRTIPLSGGVWDLYQYPHDSIIYIGNSNGLFEINSKNYSYRPVTDGRYLPCAIYCMSGDMTGKLWMSTNNGILCFNPGNNSAQLFGEHDGVSSREFNNHSFYRDSFGNFYFGGTKGITTFNPRHVKSSKKHAPIDVYELMINNEPSKKYRTPDVVRSLSLPYRENTLRFEFQAIDYADPQATRVKYMMSSYDDDWIESPTSKGDAHYANMRPGDYRFSMKGANADGVYSTDVRTVDITILPPFYMTWWFRISATVFILGISYLILRTYYRRKLERKDLLLQQQALVIEKQQAVEHERDRIASEMHDDLGSGLTRIKFLSERALRKTEDPQETEHIKRIAEQSNRLVTNMSEIIWAMNSRFDTAENLAGYIRRYASEYLEEHGIPLTFYVNTPGQNIQVSAEKRRNIFLTIKEALHNGVKYSGAQAIEIKIDSTKTGIEVAITEKQSVGFDPEIAQSKGNGLYNMQQRMQKIGGTIRFSREGQDMYIALSVPLETAEP